uniref:Uncharacterized protein n=1 Tax=viral metagenome TaxID=1070528 RepID=A0A6C0CUV3_9ZZZZ
MEQTAVQRTFSHDKYDAMEANIHYVDINEKGNSSPTSKKRKNDKKIYYVVVTVLLTIIAICILQGAIKNNTDVTDNSPSRALYENFNLSEMEQYEHHSMLGDDLSSNNHYFNNLNLYYNETEFISYENHDVDKYKKSYYKLLKVCIPQLRRAHA